MKRRFTKTPVTAAEGQTKGQEAFDEAMGNLEDDFAYVIDGLEKLSRDGNSSEALQLVLEMSSAVQTMTDKIAAAIAEE